MALYRPPCIWKTRGGFQLDFLLALAADVRAVGEAEQIFGLEFVIAARGRRRLLRARRARERAHGGGQEAGCGLEIWA